MACRKAKRSTSGKRWTHCCQWDVQKAHIVEEHTGNKNSTPSFTYGSHFVRSEAVISLQLNIINHSPLAPVSTRKMVAKEMFCETIIHCGIVRLAFLEEAQKTMCNASGEFISYALSLTQWNHKYNWGNMKELTTEVSIPKRARTYTTVFTEC
jgi:hypothetical protein